MRTRRCSGSGRRRLWALRSAACTRELIAANRKTSTNRATPRPRKTRPDVEVVNPYWPSKTGLKVVKRMYSMPKTRATYREMTRRIGEPKRSIIGRTSDRSKSWRVDLVQASLDARFEFPVEVRRLAALRSRRMRGCVSRMTTRVATARTPPSKARIQNVQRQPFAAAIKPPRSGPRTYNGHQGSRDGWVGGQLTGPVNGPRLKMDIAEALCSR